MKTYHIRKSTSRMEEFLRSQGLSERPETQLKIGLTVLDRLNLAWQRPVLPRAHTKSLVGNKLVSIK